MSSLRWQCLIVDCADPEPVATFWAAALGWRRTHVSDDGGEIVLEPPEGSPEDGVSPDLLFIRVPDPTPGKNKLHIDLRPTDQAAEVARLEALGATRAEVGQSERDNATWVVMADVEGNEFCVLRAFTAGELAEIAAGG
jgi:glyoxalase superfamily protein